MYRIIGADGKPYGPVSAEQLRAWIAERRAHAQTLAQTEGAASWKPLATFPEFADLAVPPAYAPTPPSAGAQAPAPFASAGAHPLKSSPMAVAGFVCSLLGLICCGPLLSILGLIFSIVGIGEINRHPDQFTGKSLAVAGVVLGALGLVVYGIAIAAGASGEILKGLRHHRRWVAMANLIQ
jgi:hypothetical protein